MRIIADRKDYYDCIMGMSFDNTTLYIRKSEEIKFGRAILGRRDNLWPFPRFNGSRGRAYVIGFCGKIYPLVELWPPDEPSRNINERPAPSIKCFDLEQVDAFMARHLKKRELKEYQAKGKNRRRYIGWWSSLDRRHYEEFFKNVKEAETKYEEMFLTKNFPVFVANEHDNTIEWNALLNQYDFFRVFDPYTAFQEIEMFMSNLAVPQKDMPIIDDKMKAQSKGFTDQSFRTRKEF